MKKFAIAAVALIASVTVATAGGPVVVTEEVAPVVVAGAPSSGGIWLPLAGLAAVAALAASSSGSH